jgi:hypothetical protein
MRRGFTGDQVDQRVMAIRLMGHGVFRRVSRLFCEHPAHEEVGYQVMITITAMSETLLSYTGIENNP